MELGRLSVVDPRYAWASEPHDFTPWLLANGDHLADALGIDLELTSAEHPVGGFSLDLIGRDLTNDTVLIVENQLGPTDHTHLGQVLTYAAGTDAGTIVWIATDFREEHRQALDWLNEQTREDVHFFGVKVGVVRIGDSPPAPLFDVVAQPNDWQKRVRTAASPVPGGRSGLYQQFWTEYLERLRAEHPDWSRSRKPSAENWMQMRSPLNGTFIIPALGSSNRLRHELYIDAGDHASNAEIFQSLLARRAVVEAAYGRPLVFEELPNRRASKVVEYRDNSPAEEVDRYDEYIDWFFDCGTRLRKALAAASASGSGPSA